MQAIIEKLKKELTNLESAYKVCGIVDQDGQVYPLGSDTKVLSTIFELISRPIIYKIAEERGLKVVEPDAQNKYPDFTLMKDEADTNKIAIDVKTTYRKRLGAPFGYTLGGYTSFIREGNDKKSIVYSFKEYAHHIIIGFVYDRVALKKSAASHVYSSENLKDIPLPFKNVQVFVQEKWRIASGVAGSGNTTNIGSISGTLEEFTAGKGPFESEEEFLEYWRGYGRTKSERSASYSDVATFRRLKKAKL